jgi:hypothetical protein
LDLTKPQLNWALREMEQGGLLMISDDIVYLT